VDHAVAEIESKDETAHRVVFNDAPKISAGFRTGRSFVRKDAAAGFGYAEWIAAKMNEARSRLQENAPRLHRFPAFTPKNPWT